MSPYVKLPKGITFTVPRRAGKQTDEFDILIDGKKVHTFSYDTSQIMGGSSEEFVIAEAHVNAKDWLRGQHLLPVGE